MRAAPGTSTEDNTPQDTPRQRLPQVLHSAGSELGRLSRQMGPAPSTPRPRLAGSRRHRLPLGSRCHVLLFPSVCVLRRRRVRLLPLSCAAQAPSLLGIGQFFPPLSLLKSQLLTFIFHVLFP